MALNTEKDLKLYYSIKEVAEMFGVSEPTLRYWETEFPYLKPKTGKNKVRQYTKKDIEEVRTIHNLVKLRGFKIASARKIISGNRQGADPTVRAMEKMASVKEELQKLKDLLDAM